MTDCGPLLTPRGKTWVRFRRVLQWQGVPPIGILVVVSIALGQLFAPGSLFVGDYTVGPVDISGTYLSHLGQPVVLSNRNGGYDFLPYAVRWPDASFYAVSNMFVVLTGQPTFAKLALLVYVALAALGMYVLIRRALSRDIKSQPTLLRESSSVLFSITYAVNPLTLQFILKGYVGAVETLGLLPWILVAYDWYSASASRVSIVTRALGVAVLCYAILTYTYPALLVAAAIFSFEVAQFATSPYKSTLLRIAARVLPLTGFLILMELPTLLSLSTSPLSQYLHAASQSYQSANSGITFISSLSLTTGSFGSEYYLVQFGVIAELYVAMMIILLVFVLVSVISRRMDRWIIQGLVLLVIGFTLAEAPILDSGAAVYRVLPYFPESFELLPLFALALFLLAGIVFGRSAPWVVIPDKRRQLTLAKSRSTALLSIAFATLLCLSSFVPVAFALHSNLQPTEVPSYDRQAFAWIRSQPGEGRVLIVPPSYANAYPYDSGVYAGPTDYWTLTAPHPVVIDNGGSMGGLETMDAKALYSGAEPLLERLLISEGVQYVAVRSDVVRTWDVPGFRPISPEWITSQFPFLQSAATFGPIAILENKDYSGEFLAFPHPLIVDGNSSLLSSLAQLVPPSVPLVFASDVPSSLISDVISTSSSPVLELGNRAPPFCSPGACTTDWIQPAKNATANELSMGLHHTLTIIGTPFLNTTAYGIDTSTGTFQSTFDGGPTLGPNWTEGGGGIWHEEAGALISPQQAYQPYAAPVVLPSSEFTRISTSINVVSGFAGGVVLSNGTSNIVSRSFEIWLIPSWSSLLVSHYVNGSGSWISMTHLPLSFNKSYELNITRFRSLLSVAVDGVTIAQTSIDYQGALLPALASSQAEVRFYEIGVSDYSGSTLDATSGLSNYQGRSWLTFLNVSQTSIATFSSGGTALGFAISDTNVSGALSLAPGPLPLIVLESGALAWTMRVPSSQAAFVATPILSSSGWATGPNASIVMTNGYAVGFVLIGETTLHYRSNLPVAVDFSTGLIVMGGALALFELLLAVSRQRTRPAGNPRR